MVDLVQWSLFLLFSVLVLGGALGVFLTMSMYRAGISLMLSLVAMAGLFILLEADLLAVIQVMMNVGGMLVMTLFMVMLMMDPGGEMMWDMKRGMKMKGFAALSMSMPPEPRLETPGEKSKEKGRTLSPLLEHTHNQPEETGTSTGTNEAAKPLVGQPQKGRIKLMTESNTNENRYHTHNQAQAGTAGPINEGDPYRRVLEIQRSIGLMQQQLGLMEQQLVGLQEDLLGGWPKGQQSQAAENIPGDVVSPSHQIGQSNQMQSNSEGNQATTMYTCPMHPEVRQPKPGRCPKCGMDLVPEGGGDGEDGDRPGNGSGRGGLQTGSSSAGDMEGHSGHDQGRMAHTSTKGPSRGGEVETAEQMQRRSPKAYYRMMAGMAMSTPQLPLAGIFSLVAGLLLVVRVLLVAWPARVVAPDLDGPSRVGDLLLSDYMVAFEGAAFLILAGILGAVLLARRERTRTRPRKGAWSAASTMEEGDQSRQTGTPGVR